MCAFRLRERREVAPVSSLVRQHPLCYLVWPWMDSEQPSQLGCAKTQVMEEKQLWNRVLPVQPLAPVAELGLWNQLQGQFSAKQASHACGPREGKNLCFLSTTFYLHSQKKKK